MRVCKNGNWKNDSCIVCGTKDKGEVVLVGIAGTESEGNMQARQAHLKCVNLMFDKKWKFIYQKVKG